MDCSARPGHSFEVAHYVAENGLERLAHALGIEVVQLLK